MYSTYNDRKSVVAERFIRTLKNNFLKHVTAVSKNVYFNLLDDIVGKYNNAFQKTIKMKPVNVTSDSYAEYNEDSIKPSLNSKLVIMLGFENTETFLLKDIRKIGQKKVLSLVNLKLQFRGLT